MNTKPQQDDWRSVLGGLAVMLLVAVPVTTLSVWLMGPPGWVFGIAASYMLLIMLAAIGASVSTRKAVLRGEVDPTYYL